MTELASVSTAPRVPHDPGLDHLDLDNPKVRQILAGARSAFLALGYEGASVDEIARRAQVSKPTLYNHFENKQAVFSAFVRVECHEQAERTFAHMPEADGIEARLGTLARGYLTFLLSEFTQDLYRLAVAEAPRFPELGQVFFHSGPGLAVARIEVLLKRAHAAGELHAPNPRAAAYQFIEICKADLFYKRVFKVIGAPSAAQIRRVADTSVAAFMRAYAALPQACHPAKS